MRNLSRQEFLVGAGIGTVLALDSASSRAETSAVGQLMVGAAKRISTPTPLLPAAGPMSQTRQTRDKKGELTARAMVSKRDGVSMAVVALHLLGFTGVLA